jgi:hypothetical protein
MRETLKSHSEIIKGAQWRRPDAFVVSASRINSRDIIMTFEHNIQLLGGVCYSIIGYNDRIHI